MEDDGGNGKEDSGLYLTKSVFGSDFNGRNTCTVLEC